MKNKIIVFSALFLALIVVLLNFKTFNLEYYFPYARYLPIYDINFYPPKVLVYSSLNLDYIAEHAAELKNKYGFDGFILTQTPVSTWPGDYTELKKFTGAYKKANKIAAASGLKDNFLKIALDQGNIPLWQDDKQWAEDLKNIKKIAHWAKDTGFVGLAFDTEPYNKFIWHNGIKRNRLPNIEKIIEQRGRELVLAVMNGFPEAELLVFPEGHLFAYTKKQPNKYAYWINFFNGMLNAKPHQGLTLLCERMYTVYNQLRLRNYYNDIQGEIIADNIDDPGFWLTKCSIGFGMWPLGREYSDKRANLSPQEFNEQFNSAVQYCPKYVWIYAHGLSWWQFANGKKYGVDNYEATLPLVKDIADYKKIILRSKDENLKYFYKELKYNKKYSYLGRILEKAFKPY